MNCIRCGREATQYGTDGMSYCDSCLFYGMNKQCQKCGMYLPALELQMYQGNWYCPYCIMDLKDQNKPKYEKKESYNTEGIKYEQCDRCGRTLDKTVFIFRDRKLCPSCLDEEKDKDTGPVTPPIMRINLKERKDPFYMPIIKPAGMFAEGLFGWILRKLGLKKKQQETEIVEVIREEEKIRKRAPATKKPEKPKEESKEKKEKKDEEEEEKTDWDEHKQD